MSSDLAPEMSSCDLAPKATVESDAMDTAELGRNASVDEPSLERTLSVDEPSIERTATVDEPNLVRTLSVDFGMEADAAAAELLLNRGVRLVKHSETQYVFSGADGKVATALWVYRGKGVLNAFTKSSIDGGDNFDAIGGPSWAVENFTFGYGKLRCEAHSLEELLNDPGAALAAYHSEASPNKWLTEDEKVKVDAVRADVAAAAIGGEVEAMTPFFVALLRKGLQDTVSHCSKIVADRDPPADDPVYEQLPKMIEAVEAFDKKTAREALDEFFRIKALLVDHLPKLHPKLAKMGLGRGSLYSLIAAKWEGEKTRLHMWSVFFTRLYLLCSDPLAAYIFFMLNAFGKSDELSKFDDLWAHLNKPQTDKKAGPLCDLINADGAIAAACASRIEGLMRRTAPRPMFLDTEDFVNSPKLLGVANGWVAAAMLSMVTGEAINMQTELLDEMAAAKAYLTATGWEAGVNEFVNAAGRTDTIFDPAPIAEEYAALMRTATLADAVRFIERIAIETVEASKKRPADEASLDEPPARRGSPVAALSD